MQQFDRAIEKLRLITVMKASCMDDTYRLFAGIALRLDPPEFHSAVDSLSQIIVRNNRDFAAVSLPSSEFIVCLNDFLSVTAACPLLLLHARMDGRCSRCRHHFSLYSY
jgi:hypothetical protein